MTVRDKVGRTRYVAFRIEGGPVPRPAFAGALPDWARLTRYDGVHGIVRCRHIEVDALRAALAELARIGGRAVSVVTLATSGTIRAAAEALPPGAAAAARSPPRK